MVREGWEKGGNLLPHGWGFGWSYQNVKKGGRQMNADMACNKHNANQAVHEFAMEVCCPGMILEID